MTETTFRNIAGGGGCMIHVRDSGPRDGIPIVLIHGWAQNHLCWQRQIDSDLARDLRLIALDLRGHGMSDKPDDPTAYTDGAMWAADIHAVITDLNLHRPMLVGWSYGGRVIGEYLDIHGDAALGGIALTGAICATGKAREDWMVGPASPGLDRDLYTDDLPRRLAATIRFVENCAHDPLDPHMIASFTGFNMVVPAHVRRALFAVDRDLRPTYSRVTCPALITHGEQDRIVACATADAFARAMPHAGKLIMPDTGHMPFLERPDAFNAALRALALQGVEAA